MQYGREPKQRAYHEAGHALLASRYSFEIRTISVVTTEKALPGTRFATLNDLRPASANDGAKIWERVEQYAMVRLAGPIAELIYDGIRAGGPPTGMWPSWQAQRKEELLAADDVDLDVAYAVTFAWAAWARHTDLDKRLDQLWDRTFRFLRSAGQWQKADRLAKQLLKVGVMTGAEAFSFLSAS